MSIQLRGLLVLLLLGSSECYRVKTNSNKMKKIRAHIAGLEEVATKSGSTFWPWSAGNSVCRVKSGEDPVKRYQDKVAKLQRIGKDAASGSMMQANRLLGRMEQFRDCTSTEFFAQLRAKDQRKGRSSASDLENLMYPADGPGKGFASVMQGVNDNMNSALAHHDLSQHLEARDNCGFHLENFNIQEVQAALDPEAEVDKQIFGAGCDTDTYVSSQKWPLSSRIASMRTALKTAAKEIKAGHDNPSQAQGLQVSKDEEAVKETLSDLVNAPEVAQAMSLLQTDSEFSASGASSALQLAGEQSLVANEHTGAVTIVTLWIIVLVGFVLFMLFFLVKCLVTMDVYYQNERLKCMSDFLLNRGRR